MSLQAAHVVAAWHMNCDELASRDQTIADMPKRCSAADSL